MSSRDPNPQKSPSFPGRLTGLTGLIARIGALGSDDFVQTDVDAPWKFTLHDLAQVFGRAINQTRHDNVSVVAAGVAFFALLSVFPMISACLSVYGYFADLSDVQEMANFVRPLLPEQAWSIISNQIAAVVSAPDAELSLRFLISLALALFTAGSGIRAILRAMNVAYGETESRNIFVFYAIAGLMTVSLFIFVYLSLLVIIGVPAALAFLTLDGTAASLTQILPWVLLVGIFAFGAGIIYRFGPSRRPPRKRWVLPGVIFTTVMWLLISWGFSNWVGSFGRYEATYGGLSAVIILLLWFWLSAMVVIFGAELNAEMERQTMADTIRISRRDRRRNRRLAH